jgi:hydrogenase maturation protease
VGNVDLGDDGFGVRLAEALRSEIGNPKSAGNPKSEIRTDAAAGALSDFGVRASFGIRLSAFGLVVRIAGTAPERHVPQLVDGGFDTVLFLDAVEFGATPGSVILLNSCGMAARFPQISTHRISLGLLAKLIEADGRTKAWLLGAQPETLQAGGELSPPMKAAVDRLTQLIAERVGLSPDVPGGAPACSAFRVPRSALPC